MKYMETAQVLAQEALAGDIYSMYLNTEQIAKEAKPGQFISVYSRDGASLLPRPISICEICGDRLRIVYRVVGKGTKEFSGYQPGGPVRIMGPLGNGFPLEAAEGKTALIIGGGIGIFPLLELAKQLKGRKEIVLGYRDQVFMKEAFEACGPVTVATEDGSQGTKGNVLDAIRENGIRADVIYACGPAPMLKGIQSFAAEQNLEAWISLEERMACGIGACLACICKSKEVDAHTNVHNKRVCKDGPVFRAKEVEL